LNWTTETSDAGVIRHTANCAETVDQDVQAALYRCADYAFSLLEDNIQDDSMFCLFIWDAKDSAFSIVVTDEKKGSDAKHRVTLSFTGFSGDGFSNLADSAKYWLTDYLTTCPSFLAFSLLAAFVRGDRAKVELM